MHKITHANIVEIFTGIIMQVQACIVCGFCVYTYIHTYIYIYIQIDIDIDIPIYIYICIWCCGWASQTRASPPDSLLPQIQKEDGPKVLCALFTQPASSDEGLNSDEFPR